MRPSTLLFRETFHSKTGIKKQTNQSKPTGNELIHFGRNQAKFLHIDSPVLQKFRKKVWQTKNIFKMSQKNIGWNDIFLLIKLNIFEYRITNMKYNYRFRILHYMS